MASLVFVAAVLYSSVGHAGASGYLAAMALVGVAPDVMRPTALVLNLLVASIATYRFARAGHFSRALLWPFVIGSVPLAFVGGALQLPGHWYRALVGLVLFAAALRLFTDGPRRLAGEGRPARRVPLGIAIACGAAIGLLAGLTGTGGGIFLSPLLVLTGWAETRQTGGVSAAFILVNSAAGLLANPASLGLLPPAFPFWAVAAIAGGLIGSELGARRVATRTFRRLLAIVLVVAASKLVWT